MMEPENYIPPNEQDILLSDVAEEDLKQIATVEFNIEFLSLTSEEPSWPVNGIVRGDNHRLFISLIVRRKSKAYNVIFLIDTGSPSTFISKTTMEKLVSKSTPKILSVNLHGFETDVHLSTPGKHFEDINVLGSDFLHTSRSSINIDYFKRNITMNKH